ncbi:MAG: hypothetical protein ACK5MW_06680 [Enterococcus sp.]
MENQVNGMCFKELKELVDALAANPAINEQTKVFLDTGWDSLQEILPGAIAAKQAKAFQVQDELTKEFFGGYSLAEKLPDETTEETVIVIENLY